MFTLTLTFDLVTQMLGHASHVSWLLFMASYIKISSYMYKFYF